jgi:predicted alpha/beta hydrolase family esterase
MHRRAIIFHGTNASPDVAWYPRLAERLAARGLVVEVPHYPGLNAEPIADFAPKVLAAHQFGESTVLVGHSGGAALILALLEHVTVDQAILVAGYCTPPNTKDEPVLQEAITGRRSNPMYATSRSSTPATTRTAATNTRAAPCSTASAAHRLSATTVTSATTTRCTTTSPWWTT